MVIGRGAYIPDSLLHLMLLLFMPSIMLILSILLKLLIIVIMSTWSIGEQGLFLLT